MSRRREINALNSAVISLICGLFWILIFEVAVAMGARRPGLLLWVACMLPSMLIVYMVWWRIKGADDK